MNHLDHFNDYLNRYWQAHSEGDPSQLTHAAGYALRGEGKRVRPLLVMLSCEAVGGDSLNALPAALAVEMIHTYSLVHDDLPCMDDDDMRRGRPTVHKVYDESTALLAGDALLTDAFTHLISGSSALSAEARAKQVLVLSKAAGGQGMVLGQSLDLYWTARTGASLDELLLIHKLKTAGLIEASCAIGGIAGGASELEQKALSDFGRNIGLSFQIRDDLLDLSEEIGKSPGKDQAMGKLTFASTMSYERAMDMAETLTIDAVKSLENLPGNTVPLLELAQNLLNRRR